MQLIDSTIPLTNTLYPRFIEQIFKYTPAGGEVRIAARVQDNRLLVSVHDTGPGIPPEELSHVFDPFYRLDKARSRNEGTESAMGSGAGLGLSIARRLAEQNNGEIWAESAPGGGSIFVLAFPGPQ